MNTQAILALSSGFITLIVFGSLYTFGSLTPYIASYLKYKNDETKNTTLSLLFTSTLVLVNVGVTISSMWLGNISNRKLCSAAVVGVAASVFISSFMESFIGYVFFYGVTYGLSIGFGYFPPVKNAYLHLPNRKGLCSGVCMSGFGLGSAIFNYVILALVNPNNERVQSDGFYPEEVANNLPFALKVLSGIYLIMGLLGAFFIQPPKKAKQPDLLTEESIVKTSLIQTNVSETYKSPESPFQLFRRKKAYFVMLQIGCVAPFGMFMAFNYKRVAFDNNEYFKVNDYLITIIGSIGIFCNGLFRCGWGWVFDIATYKQIMITINICLMIICGVILQAVKSVPAYAIIIPLTYLSYGGLYAITPTQSVRLLGKEFGSKLFWLIFAGFSISAIIQYTLQYFILGTIKKESTQQEKSDAYFHCIIAFFILQVIGLGLNIFVKFENEPDENYTNKVILNEHQNDVVKN